MKKEFMTMIKRFFIFFIGDFGSKVVTFIMLPFYTSYLTTTQYGTLDLMNSIVLFLMPIITLGIADAIFRFVMSKDYDNTEVLSSGLFINLIGWGLLLIISVMFSNFIKFNNLFIILGILISNTIYSLFLNYSKAINKLFVCSFVGIVQTFIFVFLNVIFIKQMSFGINGYFASNIISNSIALLLIFFILKLWRVINFKKINKNTLKVMLKYSLPLIPTTLSWWIIMLSDRYMITYFLGLATNGIYAIANKIPTILNTVVILFVQVWQISSINMYENNSQELESFYTKSIGFYELLNFLMGSILIFVSPFIMNLLVRGEYSDGWIAVPFLILSIIFSSLSGYFTAIFTAYKNNTIVCTSVLFGALANIVFNAILIPLIGITGAAIASSFGYLLVFYIRLIYSRRYVKFNFSMKRLTFNILLVYLQSIFMICGGDFKYFYESLVIVLIILNNLQSLKTLLFAIRRKSK